MTTASQFETASTSLLKKPSSPSLISRPRAFNPCLLIIALTCSLAGCHSAPPLTPQQAAGQHLYAGRCAHCHEENDLALKPPPPNIHGAMNKPRLPSGAPATDAEVRRLILTGKGKMPSFSGRFTEQQMAALLAYLHTSMPLPEQNPD